MNIYLQVLGALLRYVLTIGAAVLTPYGVGEAMQGELVTATVSLVLGAVAGLAALGWEILKARYIPVLIQKAIEAPQDASIGEVKLAAKAESRAPVIY